ncbi:MAG: hypothetical protein R6X35_14015, partial [Candidatus Krumholzibacteriia bacterium]
MKGAPALPALGATPLTGAEAADRAAALVRGARYVERPLLATLVFLAFVVARYIQIGARRDILATVRFEFLLGVAVIALASWQLGVRKPEI